MKDNENSLGNVRAEKKRIRDEKYAQMRTEEWHFACDISVQYDGNRRSIKEDTRHPKKLNIYVHLVGKDYDVNPIHYRINWNTPFDWMFQHFAGLVGIDNDVERKFTVGNNPMPDLSFYECFREGFIVPSNVVHLRCIVGTPSGRNVRERLTPNQTEDLHKEISFACLMLDNLELEVLQSRRSTSNRFQRRFLEKIIREYYPSFKYTYHYDCHVEGGWYREPINPDQPGTAEVVELQGGASIATESYAVEAASALTHRVQCIYGCDGLWLDLHRDSAAYKVLENVQATLLSFKNDDTLDRPLFYSTVSTFLTQAEAYFKCCHPNCSLSSDFWGVLAEDTAQFFCPCGLFRLCKSCFLKGHHQKDDDTLRCSSCLLYIVVPDRLFFSREQSAVFSHKMLESKYYMACASRGLKKWAQSTHPSPNFDDYAPLVEDFVNYLRKQFVCFNCGYMMSSENHLIMKSNCECAYIICRFCVYEKRMLTMISQQGVNCVPECSSQMSDNSVVCETCGEHIGNFGLCIGLSMISIICRALVLADDVERSATLRQLFVLANRKLGYQCMNDGKSHNEGHQLFSLLDLKEHKLFYQRSPIESTRNPYGCCGEYRKLHRAAAPDSEEEDNRSYQGSLSEEEDSLCEEDRVIISGAADHLEQVEDPTHPYQMLANATDLVTVHPLLTTHPLSKSSSLVGKDESVDDRSKTV